MTTAIQEYSKTDAALAELANRYKAAVFDVTNTKGMQEARTARAELRGYRVDLEKVRVEIKAPALERCRLIDAEAKRITTVLAELEDPIDEQIKKEEKRKEEEAMQRVMAEQRRKDGIAARIDAIRGRALSMAGKAAAQITDAIQLLEVTEITEAEFMEFTTDAENAKGATLFKLRELADAAFAHEAEQAKIRAEREELATLRAEQEARDKARAEDERQARAKIEAEERASRERIEEQERQAREVRAAEDSRQQAERARLAEEKRQADERVREIEKKANDVLDAKAMLATFKKRFGHLPEFAGVVTAIDACNGAKRKAA